MEGFLARAGNGSSASKKPYDGLRDYAQIFGDARGSCSIPFLSLAPDTDGWGFEAGPRIDYSEVFGGFDFGDFAVTYEELMEERKREEEIWLSNGRANSEASSRLEAKASSQQSNVPPVASPKDNKFISRSDSPTDSICNLSYSKTFLGNNQEACGETHVAEIHAFPGYAVVSNDSMLECMSEGSNDPYNMVHDGNEGTHPVSYPFSSPVIGSRGSEFDLIHNQMQNASCCVEPNSMVQGGNKVKHQVKSPSRSSHTDSRDSEFDLMDSQMQNAPGCNDYENDIATIHHHSRSSSCHSLSSVDAPYFTTKYLSASDVSLRTRPIGMPPPSKPPPKLANKIGGSTSKTSLYINNSNDKSLGKLYSGEQKHVIKIASEDQIDNKASKESNNIYLDVEVDASSAAAASAAAIKEAMEAAEARIKIAKESMEKKRDCLHNGKKVGNEEMKPKGTKADEIVRFSKNVVKGNNQTVKMPSEKIPEVELATGTVVFGTSFTDTLMKKTIVQVNEAVNKFVFEEKTKDAEMNIHEAEEVEQMLTRSNIKPAQPMGPVQVDFGNWKSNQGHFELINNEKKHRDANVFEQETIRQKVESMLKIYEGGKTVNLETAFRSDLKSQNNSKENHKRSEKGKVFRHDGVCEEEIKEVHNMVPEASRSKNFLTDLRPTTAFDEEGSKNSEKTQNAGEEQKSTDFSEEQAFATGGSICNPERSRNCEPSINEKERVLKATIETCDTEVISNNFVKSCDGEEEKAISHRLEESLEDEKNECTVAGATCEPCETFSSEVALSGESESKLPQGTSALQLERNEADTTAGSVEKATFREIKSKCIGSGSEVKECKAAKGQEESKVAKLDEVPLAFTNGRIRLVQDEKSQVVDALSNQERQGVTQRFEKETPTARGQTSLPEDCDDMEIQQNYNCDNSEQVVSIMKNSGKDMTVNVEALPVVLQIPLNRQFNVQQAVFRERSENILKSTNDVSVSHSIISEKDNDNMKKKIEVKQKERRLERERNPVEDEARKLSEEKEREREREKDRIGVERATLDVREAKERSEKIAAERTSADFRLKAFREAREKAEKVSIETHERMLAEKAQREAILRAERAAVERATSEARDRAVERALAEKTTMAAKESTGIYTTKPGNKDDPHVQSENGSYSSYSQDNMDYNKQLSSDGEPTLRCKARYDRHQRTSERAAKALAEMNMRDIIAQREQAERNRLAEYLDADLKRWSSGKEGNLRALLSTLQYILGPESGWQPISLTDVITAAAVKKAYRKATLFVHPDKLQQRGANIQQKYTCEKVFDLLKEAWHKFNSEER